MGEEEVDPLLLICGRGVVWLRGTCVAYVAHVVSVWHASFVGRMRATCTCMSGPMYVTCTRMNGPFNVFFLPDLDPDRCLKGKTWKTNLGTNKPSLPVAARTLRHSTVEWRFLQNLDVFHSNRL